MTTATSTHPKSTPPAPLTPQEIQRTVRELQTQPPQRTQTGASPTENGRRPFGPRRPERERPEDDEAVITAVLATVTHRSFRERPEDDEVIPTYTSEPACRPTR